MQNPFSLESHNVMVTGAAQGIGRKVAEFVVGLGGRVATVDLNGDGVKSVTEDLGENARGYVGSVTDQAFIDSVVADMVRNWGGVQGLMNNAGIVRAAMIHKMSREQWDEVINVNRTGV